MKGKLKHIPIHDLDAWSGETETSLLRQGRVNTVDGIFEKEMWNSYLKPVLQIWT